MNDHTSLEKLRKLYSRVRMKLNMPFLKPSKSEMETSKEKPKLTLERPQSIAYRILGEKTGRFLPLFKGLDTNLQKSGVKINFKAYVSLTVLATLLMSTITLVVTPFMTFFVFNVPVLPAILFGVGGSLFASAFSIIAFYAYPIYRADKHKRDLEDELPFTTGYMGILTSAGVSPEKIFYSLSSLAIPLAVSAEAKDIVRDVSLFGQDIISALQSVSKRTPSERFRGMLEGFISTIHSGSNSTAYLNEKSKQYMKLKRISLKKFSDTLSVLSEFYVTLLLTGPLLLVIMLAVMAMLGGSDLGLLSPDLLLSLLTYLGIPVGSVLFLIILDAVTPRW